MFFGDSWIAEGGIAEGFARYLAQHDEFRCFQIVNAGVGSFSPSLITLKAAKMIEIEQPMLVVINIDETDLMDEWIRYRYSSVRDASGELIAVLPSLPDIPDFTFYYSLLALEEQPIYLFRLIEKLYLTRVLTRRVMDIHKHQYMLPTIENLFAPQTSDNPRVEFAEPIAYFRERVLEMITRLRRATGAGGDVVLTHHPHFLHIKDDDGKHYNDIVQHVLAEATKKSDAPFHDATPEFAAIHGPDPSDVFRWPEDRYSHLTHRSYVEYGYWIGERTAPLLRARLGSTGSSRPDELQAYDGVICENASPAVITCWSVPEPPSRVP